MLISFIGFLALFTLIGLSSAWSSKGTHQDYYIASGQVKAWLVGLSAVATNNSGYMFIGVIGYTYSTGLASIWLMIGWIAGDFLASTMVHLKLKQATDRSGQISYAGVLSHWYGNGDKTLQRLIALISLLFLLAYASAQLVAGSKALQVLLGWPHWAGAVVGAVLLALYCLAGGIRASIWTDAAQSIVMVFAMAILVVVAVLGLGGLDSTVTQLHQVEGFMDWLPEQQLLPGIAGGLLFIVGWLFAGMSVIGQPHIMVRFMALENEQTMVRARIWYYLSFTLFYALATAVGLLSRLYIDNSGSFDAELALPTMALQLLPPMLVGLVLAGIFAATMSTADSLVLSCSAAISHDLLPMTIKRPLIIKSITLLVAITALMLALSNNQSVFDLVIFAWSGLASAFAPLLLLLCFGYRPTQIASVLAVLVGLTTAIAWRLLEWHGVIYEGLPGIAAGLLVFALAALFSKRSQTLATSS